MGQSFAYATDFDDVGVLLLLSFNCKNGMSGPTCSGRCHQLALCSLPGPKVASPIGKARSRLSATGQTRHAKGDSGTMESGYRKFLVHDVGILTGCKTTSWIGCCATRDIAPCQQWLASRCGFRLGSISDQQSTELDGGKPSFWRDPATS